MESTNTAGKTYEFEKNHVQHPSRCGAFLLHQLTEVFCEPDHRFGDHQQWCSEISYVISGTGVNYTDGTAEDIGAGDVIVTPKGVIHAIESHDRLRYLCIGFDIDPKAQADDIDVLRRFYERPPATVIKGSDKLMHIMQWALDDQYGKNALCDYTLEKCIYLLCVEAYRCFTDKRRLRYLANDNDDLKTYGMPLYGLLLYIDTNISEIGEITELCDRLGYNACYLSHLFKEKTGSTLREYICRRRVEESLKVFATTHNSLREAAKAVGFSNTQTYSKAFKRIKGMSPREYLRIHPPVGGIGGINGGDL